jgi:hypothetical protein
MFRREVVTGQKTGPPVRYAQIVEKDREAGTGKSKHRGWRSRGRVEALDQDPIRRLMISLSRDLETGKVPEGGRRGEVREFGLPDLADPLWDPRGLPNFLARPLRKRKDALAVERALLALVAHRLADPRSKRSCAQWRALDAYRLGTRGLTVQPLDRAMDCWDDAHDEVEHALYPHRRTLFDRARVVYLDTTRTDFDGDQTGDPDEPYGLPPLRRSSVKSPERAAVL